MILVEITILSTLTIRWREMYQKTRQRGEDWLTSLVGLLNRKSPTVFLGPCARERSIQSMTAGASLHFRVQASVGKSSARKHSPGPTFTTSKLALPSITCLPARTTDRQGCGRR